MHDRRLDPDARLSEVDVAPPQTADLASPHSRGHEHPEGNGDVGRRCVDQADDVARTGRADASSMYARRTGDIRGVGRQPAPPHALSERRVQGAVIPVHGRRLPSVREQADVQRIQPGGADVGKRYRADVWQALPNRGPIAHHGGDLETRRGVRQPGLDELADGSHERLRVGACDRGKATPTLQMGCDS